MFERRIFHPLTESIPGLLFQIWVCFAFQSEHMFLVSQKHKQVPSPKYWTAPKWFQISVNPHCWTMLSGMCLKGLDFSHLYPIAMSNPYPPAVGVCELSSYDVGSASTLQRCNAVHMSVALRWWPRQLLCRVLFRWTHCSNALPRS